MNSLRFKNLTVHNLSGVVESFEIPEFHEQLNIIYGPNGEGKSLTGKSLQTLIWPNLKSLENPKLSAEFVMGKDSWEIKIVAGEPDWKLNGRPSNEGPKIRMEEFSAQYWLGLQELLSPEGTHHEANIKFAKEIDTKFRGGVNLDSIAKELKFKSKPRRPEKHISNFKAAKKNLDIAKNHQRELDDKLKEKTKNEDEEKEAKKAVKRIESLDLLERIKAEEKGLRDVVSQLGEFDDDDRLEKMSEGDLETLDGLENEVEEIEEALLSSKKDLDRQKSNRDETGFVELDEGPDRDCLEKVDLLLSKANKFESRVVECRTAKGTEEKGFKSLAESIARYPEVEKVLQKSSIDPKPLTNVPFEKLITYFQRRRSLETEIRNFELEVGKDSGSTDEAESNISIWDQLFRFDGMSHWFSFFWGSIITVGCLCSIPILNRDSSWGVFAVANVSLLVAWAGAPLLYQRITQSARNEEKENNRNQRLEDFEIQGQGLKEERDEIISALDGFDFDGGKKDWLDVLASNMKEWQKKKSSLDSTKEELKCAEKNLANKLKEINKCLKPYKIEVNDCDGARVKLNSLRERRSKFDSAMESIKIHKDIIKNNERKLKSAENKRKDFFKVRGFEPNEVARFREIHRTHWKNYNKLKEERFKKNVSFEGRRSDYKERVIELGSEEIANNVDLKKEIDQILDEKERLKGKAGELGKLSKKIASDEAILFAAESQRTIDEAFQQLSKNKAELEAELLEEEKKLLGGRIVKWVREESARSSDPEVLRYSNKVLSDITHGRYQLYVRSLGEELTFVVKDTQDDLEKELGVLSAGERVQVLLAVRLGFLQSSEKDSTSLPLILDEVLATTDDKRAVEIIDTILELVASGRQVFYLTAQRDEVRKWQNRLGDEKWRDKKIDYKQIELAHIRNSSNDLAADFPNHIDAPPDLPDPNLTYMEYGKRLSKMGKLKSLKSTLNLGRVDLFYLIENTGQLHALRKKSIDCWGPFKTFVIDKKTADEYGISEEEIVRFDERAIVIERLLKSSKIGRPDSVDRAVLKNASLGINEDKFHELSELAQEVEGEGDRLIMKLKGKKIKNWQTKNTEKLEDFFETHGYIDPQIPWDREKLRDHVLDHLAGNNHMDSEWLDRTIGFLVFDQNGELNES